MCGSHSWTKPHGVNDEVDNSRREDHSRKSSPPGSFVCFLKGKYHAAAGTMTSQNSELSLNYWNKMCPVPGPWVPCLNKFIILFADSTEVGPFKSTEWLIGSESMLFNFNAFCQFITQDSHYLQTVALHAAFLSFWSPNSINSLPWESSHNAPPFSHSNVTIVTQLRALSWSESISPLSLIYV